MDEEAGVNVLDDREGCVFTGFEGVAGLFGLAVVAVVGDGVLELTATFVSGSGVLLTSSGETDCAIVIAFGYKSPIVVWSGLGYKSFDIVAGAAVIIVTNKNAEMTGTRSGDHFIFFIVFILSVNFIKETGFQQTSK